MRRGLTQGVLAAMRDCDVLITANQYGPAERYAEATDPFPFFRRPFLTMPFNVTGQPAVTVPCAFTDTGLPLGVQIAGRPFDEPTVLRVAHAYETVCGAELLPPI